MAPPALLPPPRPNRRDFPYEGRLRVAGIDVLVETAAGSYRAGTDPDGKPWRTRMRHHYGEIPGTTGADGDPVDVYVGSALDAETAYVVHQKVPRTQVYDEDKVMLGFCDAESARAAYLAHYDRTGFYGGMTPWPVAELREYLRTRQGGNRLDRPRRVRRLVKGAGGWRDLVKAEQLGLFDGPLAIVEVKPHVRVTPGGEVVAVAGSRQRRRRGPMAGLRKEEREALLAAAADEGLGEEHHARLVARYRAARKEGVPAAQAPEVASKYLEPEPPPPGASLDEAVRHIEDQIRGRSHEHMGVWIDGQYHESGPTHTETYLTAHHRGGAGLTAKNVCVLPPALHDLMQAGDLPEGGVLTHNHPSGGVLSGADVYLTVSMNLREVRACTPDGGAWRMRRPPGGWSVQIAIDYARVMHLSNETAQARMAAHLVAAGGPIDADLGPASPHWDDRKWRHIAEQAFLEQWDAFVASGGGAPPLEREQPRGGSAPARGSLDPVRLAKAGRAVTVRPHVRGGRLVQGHTREIDGSRWDAPSQHGGSFVVERVEGDQATVRHDSGARVTMPAASVPHYARDLSGTLDHPDTATDPAVNRVLREQPERAGKGNDGIVYRAGHEAVKVSTTVPYQPHNPGHRSPEGAIEHLRGELEAHRALGDLPHVPSVRGEEHDGRFWLVKPWLHEDIGGLRRDELDSVAKTLERMHHRGWVLGDSVQLGRDATGGLRLMDLGQARRSDSPADKGADMDRLDTLYRQHGHLRIEGGAEGSRRLAAHRVMLDAALAQQDAAHASTHYARWAAQHEVLAAEALAADDDDNDALDRWMGMQDEAEELGARVSALRKGGACRLLVRAARSPRHGVG